MKWMLAALVVATLTTVGGPTHAQDRRPCVSKVEYHSGFGDVTYTRRQLEERWDVRGLGKRAAATFDLDALLGEKTFTVVYPRCAFDISVANYSVTYSVKTKEVVATTKHRVFGTPAHGHLKMRRG